MSDPLKPDAPSQDVLPYAPNWARQPGYRPSPQPAPNYDVFSEEENPSYRSMAQLFAPEGAAPAAKDGGSGKRLLRFSAIIGTAAAALALFIGYIVSPPGALKTADRPASVNTAITAIQAAITPAPAPLSASKVAVPEGPAPVAAAAAPPAPEPVLPEPTQANLATNRGAAPLPPPEPLAAEVQAPAEAPQAAEPAPSHVELAALPQIETPAPSPPPAAPTLTAAELATLMARGRRFIDAGDFSSARPVYRRAAEAGYAEAALALGETFDPVALQERGVVGMSADAKQARRWYERARELGSLEAPTRLERLRD